MSKEWLITFRSVTYAQRAQEILRSSHMPCRIHRTPKYLAQRGCGYCLRLQEEDALIGVELLHQAQMPYEKLYEIQKDGSVRERML